MVGGVGTAAATHLTASHFKQLQDVFVSLNEDIDGLDEDVSQLGDSIRRTINGTKNDTGMVEKVMSGSVQVGSEELSKVLEILVTGIKEAHDQLEG